VALHHLHDTPRPSAQPEAAVVRCRGLKKAFGRNTVLDGVTCDIPRGQVTVIMGPSGTGKSVLLHHMVGLLLPDAGDVIVNGYSVPHLNEKELLALRRQVGMLFQDGALFSSMNLYDNVAFPLRQHTRRPERQIRDIVMARLEEVGLLGAEDRMPNELSGGMRKRAGFARALVLEPKILLCDEPDSGLDPVRTALLCQLIKDVQRRHNCSAVIISHDIRAVFEIADYVILLHGGHVIEQGTKKQVRQSMNGFTQQFLEGAVQGPLRMD
jgi:phospholipid/cholesterol/gamma-HCH transport system ATP-binding protein